MRRSLLLCCTAILLAGGAAGQSSPVGATVEEEIPREETAAALARYTQLVREQDSAGIADLFAPDGTLEHVGQKPIAGRTAIRAFLESLSDFKVLAYETHVDGVSAGEGGITQSGTYSQTVRTPDGGTLAVHGWFLFHWRRQPDGRWEITSAKTSSAPFESAATPDTSP